MNKTYLNTLRDRAYKIAREHGFHDKDFSNNHFLMLVITELSEAVEADRKGNYCSNKISSTERYSLFPTETGRFRIEFRAFIKDTVEDELADAVIRLFDLAGLRSITIKLNIDDVDHSCASCAGKTFTESIYWIIYDLIDKDRIMPYQLINCITNIFGIAKHLNIDLLWHIEQKMKYNELREKMHGKKY